MAKVVCLFVSHTHRHPMCEVDEILAIAGRGFDGCAHARPGSARQVLLMDRETLEKLRLRPGVVKENITTHGVDLGKLQAGGWLRVGEAVLEVTIPCEPCHRMDEIRPGLQEKLRGRRGMLCRVIRSGRIRRGDPIMLDGAGQTSDGGRGHGR